MKRITSFSNGLKTEPQIHAVANIFKIFKYFIYLSQFQKWGLNLENIVGRGYKTVVQQWLDKSEVFIKLFSNSTLPPQAQFFHYSSHKLNLGINDLNSLVEIRNTVGTIKETITFFRESPLRTQINRKIHALSGLQSIKVYGISTK